MITADAVIGRVSSNHKDGEQPEIIPLGSSFENLKIAGQPVEVDLNHDLSPQIPTHSALLELITNPEARGKEGAAKRVRMQPKIRYHWGLNSEKVPPALAKGMLMEPGAGWSKSNGVLHTSLVKQVRPVGSWQLCRGASVRVRDLTSRTSAIFISRKFFRRRIPSGSPCCGLTWEALLPELWRLHHLFQTALGIRRLAALLSFGLLLCVACKRDPPRYEADTSYQRQKPAFSMAI